MNADVVLQRYPSSDQGTKGTIITAGMFTWPTLELPWRDNRPEISCIPAGVYQCELMWSRRFLSMVYHILNVPGREAIEVHKGNWAGDKALGYHSDVRGCMLIGKSYGKIEPYPEQLAILETGVGLREFTQAMGGKAFTLEVRDAAT